MSHTQQFENPAVTPHTGVRCHTFKRNSVGQLVIVAEVAGEVVDLLVDTGAASTIVDVAWCGAHRVPLVATGQVGGGAGGVRMPIYALNHVPLTIDGAPIRSEGIFAIDMSHVNDGLKMKGASPVVGVIGGDVLALHEAVIDYGTSSLYLTH